MECHSFNFQVRGIAKAKVGQAGKKVSHLVMLTLPHFRELGLTISPSVRYLALLEPSVRYLALLHTSTPAVDSRLAGTSVFPSINGRILNCFITIYRVVFLTGPSKIFLSVSR